MNELVAKSLDSGHIPGHLFCNVQPTLVLRRVIIDKQWPEIEDTLGTDKIYSNFLVNATTLGTSVTEHTPDSMTRLDHQPRN